MNFILYKVYRKNHTHIYDKPLSFDKIVQATGYIFYLPVSHHGYRRFILELTIQEFLSVRYSTPIEIIVKEIHYIIFIYRQRPGQLVIFPLTSTCRAKPYFDIHMLFSGHGCM